MKINEAAEQAGLSKRAVKYYEEQGLLHIKKRPQRVQELYAGGCTNLKRNICISEAGNRHLRYPGPAGRNK